jgi:hypothetical protein
LKWRIEIFDVTGEKIMGYSSEDTDVSALAAVRNPDQWRPFYTAVSSLTESTSG